MDSNGYRVLQSAPGQSRPLSMDPLPMDPLSISVHYPLLSIIHYPFSIILYPLSRRRQARAGTTIFFIKARSPARNSFRQKPGPLGARKSPARPARSPRKALLVHHYNAIGLHAHYTLDWHHLGISQTAFGCRYLWMSAI